MLSLVLFLYLYIISEIESDYILFYQLSIMQTVLHKAHDRGSAYHDRLETYHSFSFANYYNPEMMGFGVLRVLNDDTIDPEMGFGMHPHDNMEIITIPVEGALRHKDNI